ncbi:MAG TPA: hypothetical protein VIR63_03635 [Pontiella sp.]
MTLCCWGIPLLGLADEEISRYTADYYKINMEEHLGKEVEIHVYSTAVLDPLQHKHPGYYMLEVETAYNGIKGGTIPVLVPSSELLRFKKHYTKPGDYEEQGNTLELQVVEFSVSDSFYEPSELFAEPLKGILRVGENNFGQKFLYIVFSGFEQKKSEANAKRAKKYIGEKITIEARFAKPDTSGLLNHIPDADVFIAETNSIGIRSGQILIVIPKANLPYFSKTFLRKGSDKYQKLSGYLYEHKTGTGSFQYLYCSNHPLDKR